MAKHSEFIHGTCQQLLFSHKGGIEGALVKMKGTVVQVTAPGRQLRVLAAPDHSPKTAETAHPIFKFESFADVAGQAIKVPDGELSETTIKGVVQAWHFARHGKPSGVILGRQPSLSAAMTQPVSTATRSASWRRLTGPIGLLGFAQVPNASRCKPMQ